tara:strand:+ start:599 stop:1069 length:471 start_codon:yes stop_codon:yes gene_type:complete
MSADILDEVAQRLSSVIDNIGCLKVRRVSTGPDTISYLCNWIDEVKWYEVLSFFLLNERGWRSDISKRYFKIVKDGEATIAAGWRLSFQSEDIVGAAERVGSLLIRCAAAVEGVDPGTVASVDFDLSEEIDIPLVYSKATRNDPGLQKGKGASGIG